MRNDNITIRKATPDDVQEVYRLICALENDKFDYNAFMRIFEGNLNNPGCFYRVAEIDNKIIGFISLHIQQLLHHCGAVGEIQEFYIDHDYRGKGIGKSLMNEAKKYAETKDVKSLEVTSNKKRTENVQVYEHLGFQLTHNKFTI